MARTYKRDARGRFAGGGGGGGKRPAAKPVSRGANRLTRNNAGRITGTGNGATARGGRLRTATGNQRATQTARAKGGARAGVIKGRVTRNPGAMSKAGGGKAASASKPTAKPRKQTRKLTRQTPGTIPNKTGQSKTLTKFNSRPVGTKILAGNKLVASTTRVPLDVMRSSSDRAYARVAAKGARARAGAVVKTQQKQTTAQRAARAAANQKRVVQEVMAKGGKRPTPTKKQRRSIMTAESAKNVYATNSIDYLKVNTKKPGYRVLGR